MQNYSYKNLSDEAKAKISSLEIVPPSLYTSIFKNLADAHNVILDDVDIQANEVLDKKLDKLTSIEESAMQKVDTLDKSAKKAMMAIMDKNEDLLKETLGETHALRLEIEELKKSLYKDALTKVYNRKWLDKEILDSQGAFICDGYIFLIDMNYFKHVNDTYGHIAGDKVLVYVANHLQKMEADIIRYGGDEFIAIFRDKSQSKVTQAMHLNRELLLKKQLKFNEHKFSTSYSYGGIEFSSGDSFSEIIEKADAHMYSDKEKIKQRVKPN